MVKYKNISIMNKFIIVLVLLILGFFYVLVLNNNTATKQTNHMKTNNISIPTSAVSSPMITIKPTGDPSSSSASDSAIEATQAVIRTAKGDITLKLFPKNAPRTVANFVQKAKSGFYDNLTFHRVEDWVIQGGDPMHNGTGGGNMPVEFNNKPFVTGSLGMASRGDGKVQNDSQFFITKQDASWLNGQYTNFGIVTKGMDIVNKIQIGDKILSITISQ